MQILPGILTTIRAEHSDPMMSRERGPDGNERPVPAHPLQRVGASLEFINLPPAKDSKCLFKQRPNDDDQSWRFGKRELI